jgi:hypothetical protein
MTFKVEPTCPIPPVETWKLLSKSTIKLLESGFQVVWDENAHTITITIASTSTTAFNSSSEGSEGCPFCLKPTKGPLQFYHDKAKEILQRCIVIDGHSCGPLCSKREAQVGKEKAHEAWIAYLTSEDWFISKNGHSLRAFFDERTFNGCLEAADKKITHGAKPTFSQPSLPEPSKMTPQQARDFLNTAAQDGSWQGWPQGLTEQFYTAAGLKHKPGNTIKQDLGLK